MTFLEKKGSHTCVKSQSLRELLKDFNDFHDGARAYAEIVNNFHVLRRATLEGYLKGRVSIVLNLNVRANSDLEFFLKLLAPGIDLVLDSLVLQLQPVNVPVIGSRDDEVMFVHDIQSVYGPEECIPSVVRFYLLHHQFYKAG